MNSFLIVPFLVTFAGPAVALAIILMARLTRPGLAPVRRDPAPSRAVSDTARDAGPGLSQSVARLSRTELSHG